MQKERRTGYYCTLRTSLFGWDIFPGPMLLAVRFLGFKNFLFLGLKKLKIRYKENIAKTWLAYEKKRVLWTTMRFASLSRCPSNAVT